MGTEDGPGPALRGKGPPGAWQYVGGHLHPEKLKETESLGKLSLFSWLYGVQGLHPRARDEILAPAVEVPSPNPWDTREIPRCHLNGPVSLEVTQRNEGCPRSKSEK